LKRGLFNKEENRLNREKSFNRLNQITGGPDSQAITSVIIYIMEDVLSRLFSRGTIKACLIV
jgi:hypothetical protein